MHDGKRKETMRPLNTQHFHGNQIHGASKLKTTTNIPGTKHGLSHRKQEQRVKRSGDSDDSNSTGSDGNGEDTIGRARGKGKHRGKESSTSESDEESSTSESDVESPLSEDTE